MLESTEGFEIFVTIADEGSISAAARALDVPRETLSRRLARLEERLGVRLLHRTSRTLNLTPAGERLVQRARPLVRAAREAVLAVRQLDETPRGVLRVSIPPGGGASILGPMVSSFLRRYPLVQLDLFATSRFVDLRAEGFDVAMRAGQLKDPGLVARKLWASDLIAVAARDYLEMHGEPETLDDLTDHNCLVGMVGGTEPQRRWPTRDGGWVSVSGRLVSNDLGLLTAAMEEGEGIALLPRPFSRAGRRAGVLRAVLPDQLGATASMSLVFPERRFLPPKTRAFIEHVADWFAQQGDQMILQSAEIARNETVPRDVLLSGS
ncbi:MAG: LysR family transcriptional regulator [Myxococcota bacterium]